MAAFTRHFFGGDRAGFPQANNAGDIERARAHAAFVPAAVNDGGKLHAGILAAHLQSTDALGPVHLVRGNGHDINVLLDHIHGNLAHRLGGVRVEDDAALMTQLADLGPRLQHANLIVGGHDGHQNGLVVHGALKVFEVYQAVFLNREVGDTIAIFFQALAGVEHGLVLGDSGDDVIALLAIHFGDALDCEVVALGSAGGKNDLLGGGADQLGDAFARQFNRFFGHP